MIWRNKIIITGNFLVVSLSDKEWLSGFMVLVTFGLFEFHCKWPQNSVHISKIFLHPSFMNSIWLEECEDPEGGYKMGYHLHCVSLLYTTPIWPTNSGKNVDFPYVRANLGCVIPGMSSNLNLYWPMMSGLVWGLKESQHNTNIFLNSDNYFSVISNLVLYWRL